ncbi:MAG: pantoate--beta-alanine ligase [bacterium]|nr:pantoate--beta-alanine ligase [bacterium]
MKIIKKIKEMKAISLEVRNKGKKIGFVPTMGALHEGPLSLVDIAKIKTDHIVTSIFVNPLQFGPKEDFKAYPRDIKRDAELLEKRGVDILFAPELKEMYHDGYDTYIEVPGLSSVLCGKTRPTHFKGVCTVVCKLFNIVNPDVAVFGEKDAQQVIIIKKMVEDLNLGVKILTGPTVREPDGLAMSSRNVYLTPKERKDASVVYQALMRAKELITNGQREAKKIKKEIEAMISTKLTAKIDYIDIVKKDNLKPLETLDGECLIAVAVWFGKARLIDNITLKIASSEC